SYCKGVSFSHPLNFPAKFFRLREFRPAFYFTRPVKPGGDDNARIECRPLIAFVTFIENPPSPVLWLILPRKPGYPKISVCAIAVPYKGTASFVKSRRCANRPNANAMFPFAF
ncbi:MAG: hypothetical protein LBK91_05715, partial [Synergistaceae bacterium]|nr:hypothetical protein [Synergistaceae bacterium]